VYEKYFHAEVTLSYQHTG